MGIVLKEDLMDRGRGYMGWMAAITVGVSLTLIFLAVEKHVQIPTKTYFHSTQSVAARASSTADGGILLTVDPGLAGIEQYPLTDQTPIRRDTTSITNSNTGSHLRRPPEPAASVELLAPIASEEMTTLPLHAGSSNVEYLMDAMNEALQSPIQSVSRAKEQPPASSRETESDRLAGLPSPATITGRIPEPKRLLEQLDVLQTTVTPQFFTNSQIDGRRPPAGAPHRFVMNNRSIKLDSSEAQLVQAWTIRVRELLNRVVMQHGLEHPECRAETVQLAELAQQASRIGDSLTNHELAVEVIRVGYALQRRVAVWQAIGQCLDATSIALNDTSSTSLAREGLQIAIAKAESKLLEAGDSEAWSRYLLIDELKSWVESPQDIWAEGNDLALAVLSRLRWKRLTASQAKILDQPEFIALGEHLAAWSRKPVDYRQLLTDLEHLEEKSLSRSTRSLAGAVQVLRTSREQPQMLVASALNDHYRNANVRLNISRNMIQRFLPSGEMEVRPVRRRILDADTKGSSAIHTELDVRFLPDATGWNIDVGVVGDMLTNTASSKGPATFHNRSTAQISSHRYIRLDEHGYRVSSEPTNVSSQDYLRKMSTEYDGLPIIGDFVRLIVREQFDQKRGLAQRISRRIIAQETDAELDRRLQEAMKKAERELTQRIIGPLERLNLNPMVIAMNTTDERLSIRYRVASQAQMASHTPRPRAPTESLLSMQLHQSAINNTIDTIGLSGKTWTLAELYQRLGEAFQQSAWKLPENAPKDITIRFADTNPAWVEMHDGKLRLSLRVLSLQRGENRPIKRFVVTSTYIPVADGMHAELIRDGVVEIETRYSSDRRRARMIFAAVFVARPQIPLIAENWSDDPRSEGLAVSQVEIRDGWLAVAISEAGSQMAAEVAARSRQLKAQY